jgi:hypothetical protein
VGSSFNDVLSLSFTVDDAHRAVSITALLMGNAFNGSFVDFLNTGILSIALPQGLSFTSASGLLLTATNVAPVPEPSELALMLAGLAFVATQARRRRRKNRSLA